MRKMSKRNFSDCFTWIKGSLLQLFPALFNQRFVLFQGFALD
jgi:hypothetical protein